MAHNNGKITAPVSFADVNATVGTAHTDLGLLCKDSKINMWSKYKPISYPLIGVMTDTEFSADRGSGTSFRITWGIKRASSYNYSDFENSNGQIISQVWTYNKPTGGENSPYRLSDFNGYSQNAVPPIEIHLPSDDYIAIPSEPTASGSVLSFAFEFGNGVQGWFSNTCISLDTFLTTTEKGYYPTVQMICVIGSGSSTTKWRYAVSADKTVNGFITSGNPVGYVLVDASKMKAVFGSAACMNAGAVWTGCLILTPTKYLGTEGHYQINSGAIGRLEFKTGADRKSFTVSNTLVIDKITALSYTATIVKNTSTKRYYVSSIAVQATKNTPDAIPLTIKITLTCVGGTITGGSPTGNQVTISSSFNMPQGQTSYSYTYGSNIGLTTPEFSWTTAQAQALSGHMPVSIGVEFIPGTGYGSLSGSGVIDCSTSTLTTTVTIK